MADTQFWKPGIMAVASAGIKVASREREKLRKREETEEGKRRGGRGRGEEVVCPSGQSQRALPSLLMATFL